VQCPLATPIAVIDSWLAVRLCISRREGRVEHVATHWRTSLHEAVIHMPYTKFTGIFGLRYARFEAEAMAMMKILVLCKRKFGVSDEDLRKMQAEHAEMVRSFTHGIVTAYAYSYPEAVMGDRLPSYDLIVEITATSLEDYLAALQTPGGKAAIEHAGTYLSEVESMLLHSLQVWA